MLLFPIVRLANEEEAYRMGVQDFYGKGKTVDTSKKFT